MQYFDPKLSLIRNDFEAYYYKTLRPALRTLERSRRLCLAMFVCLVVVFFVLLPAYVITSNSETLQMIGVAAIIGCAAYHRILGAIITSPLDSFKNKNKDIIMPLFVAFFEGFEYCKHNNFVDEHITASGLFKGYDRKQNDDYFKGVYKGVDIIISEEELIETHMQPMYSMLVEREVKIFKGIFVNIKMNKNFNGNTVVKKEEGVFNPFNKPKGLENVKLEFDKFENEWEVYSDSQIEARYLLSPSFMERMFVVKNKFSSARVEFSFFNNYLFMAIDCNRDMFEASSLFTSTLNRKSIFMAFEQMLAIFSIVDTLKLNKKLGL